MPEPLDAHPQDQTLSQLVEIVNMFTSNYTEMQRFARDIGQGRLDTEIPARRNYIAAPLKELHSLLSSFTWISEQLAKGRIVEKLEYSGEISAAFNILIEKFSEGDSHEHDHVEDSWRYHKLLSVINSLPSMVILIRDTGEVAFKNTSAAHYFGEKASVKEFERSDVAALLMDMSGPFARHPGHNEIFDTTGGGKWLNVMSDKLMLPSGAAVYMHTIEDISEWKANESELMLCATTDALTGVYNRDVGARALETAIQKKNSVTSSFAFVDIDGLKSINDTYGHNEGDFAIKSISDALSSSVRDTDTVSRFGGDEFIVVFPNCKLEIAEKIVGRMHDKIEAINRSGEKPYIVSFSHGLSQIDAACKYTASDIILLTDKKMYERKRGKNMAKK